MSSIPWDCTSPRHSLAFKIRRRTKVNQSPALEARLESMLSQVAAGKLSIKDGIRWVRGLAFSDLGYAKVDHHRELRQGPCEVVYAEGKAPDEVAVIVDRMLSFNEGSVIVTRVSPAHVAAVREVASKRALEVTETPRGRAIAIIRTIPVRKGQVVVVTAGTADLPVAEEALLTATALGADVQLHADVGVAGLHRLTAIREQLDSASAVVVVAGMEGALASVVGGLVACPVVACPTSVGYGASFGGIAALLSMLSSCVPGVVVVNIDDGLGAGYVAAMIAQRDIRT
jgi:pyridinium-3,5-biscarboxylic acid mononucleotide synthase